MKACELDLDASLSYIKEFEKKYSFFQKVKYVLACASGTSAMLEALWACGVGEDTEVIVPAMTYWASAFQAFSLGAKVKYVDIEPNSLCIDPKQIENEITKKTKAIVVVHLYGHPCDMDEIMQIAKKYDIYVIEDFSHAHGANYKGKLCGSIGDIGIASCMREKAFPLVEGGVVCTNNETLYERCCAFGHYRYLGCIENGNSVKINKVKNANLLCFAGTSIGAIKNRMNPVSAALGSSILDTFEDHILELQKANNYFMDLLDSTDIYHGHRIIGEGNSMGGWYMPKLFVDEKYAKNISNYITSKGFNCYVGHKYFLLSDHFYNTYINAFTNTIELFGPKPLNHLNCDYSISRYKNVVETDKRLISAPRFLRFDKFQIEKYAEIYINALNYIK